MIHITLSLAVSQQHSQQAAVFLELSIPAAVFVYILAQNDLFWDKLSLTGCLISNYCWAVLSFENSQPTLGGKILAPIEVQLDETTLLIALLLTWWCNKFSFLFCIALMHLQRSKHNWRNIVQWIHAIIIPPLTKEVPTTKIVY